MAKLVFGALPTTPDEVTEENGVKVVKSGGVDGEALTLKQLVEWAEEASQRNGLEGWTITINSGQPSVVEAFFRHPTIIKQFTVGVAKTEETEE